MTATHRWRRRLAATLTAALALAIVGCGANDYPNSTFTNATEFNREIVSLHRVLIFWGTLVFVLVEAALIWVIWKYRRREGRPEPRHVHGNTTLEILWTVIPAVILVFIAVPTVRAIFRTQAKAVPNALQVEVIGHQWWWEFRYPEYGIVTANELYLPQGRTVNFALKTADVLHSFWVPRLGGKRDLISNHTNYLWFTPDSADNSAWNGICTEYCGSSHANMRFRAFTVAPEEFEQWVAHMKTPAVFGAQQGATAPAPATPGTQNAGVTGPAQLTSPAGSGNVAPAQRGGPASPAGSQQQGQQVAQGGSRAPGAGGPPAATVTPVGYIAFPAERLEPATRSDAPVPETLKFDDSLVGDPARGLAIYSRSTCIGCHVVGGNPFSVGQIGPNLTHFGSRHSLAAGLFPNDMRHLARWIKNSRAMKPGVIMPTLGKGEYDPILKTTLTSGLTDQEIADIAAYLLALK